MAGLSFRSFLLVTTFAACTLTQLVVGVQQLTQDQACRQAKAEIRRTVSPQQISHLKQKSTWQRNKKSPDNRQFLDPHTTTGSSSSPIRPRAHHDGVVCSVCTSVALAAVKTGWFCDPACLAAVETLGGGPEDLLADGIASQCPTICGAAVKGASGYGACHIVDLC